jgi:hypothetical protein
MGDLNHLPGHPGCHIPKKRAERKAGKSRDIHESTSENN